MVSHNKGVFVCYQHTGFETWGVNASSDQPLRSESPGTVLAPARDK